MLSKNTCKIRVYSIIPTLVTFSNTHATECWFQFFTTGMGIFVLKTDRFTLELFF